MRVAEENPRLPREFRNRHPHASRREDQPFNPTEVATEEAESEVEADVELTVGSPAAALPTGPSAAARCNCLARRELRRFSLTSAGGVIPKESQIGSLSPKVCPNSFWRELMRLRSASRLDLRAVLKLSSKVLLPRTASRAAG